MAQAATIGRANSVTVSVAAPIGGLNARDAVANMKPTDALIMDNWFPSEGTVNLRNGSALWSSGYTAPVETLMAYNGNAAHKLFAAAGTAIYDATTTGPASMDPIRPSFSMERRGMLRIRQIPPIP
jgi:hypothetical protein